MRQRQAAELEHWQLVDGASTHSCVLDLYSNSVAYNRECPSYDRSKT